MAMSGTVYYLIYFERHVRANSTHRLAALVRASVAISHGNTPVLSTRPMGQPEPCPSWPHTATRRSTNQMLDLTFARSTVQFEMFATVTRWEDVARQTALQRQFDPTQPVRSTQAMDQPDRCPSRTATRRCCQPNPLVNPTHGSTKPIGQPNPRVNPTHWSTKPTGVLSHGNTSVLAGERLVRSIVRQSLSRSRVLILITVLFICSWYPLYILTLVDPKFEQPSKVYKLLTFLAWSNAAVNPVVLILFDNNVDALRRLTCYIFPSCDNREHLELDRRARKARRQPPEITSTSSAGPTSGASTPHGGVGSGGRPGGGGRPRRRAGPATGTCSPGGSIYERVGNRLWREGESSSPPVIAHSQTFSDETKNIHTKKAVTLNCDLNRFLVT